MNHRPGDQPRGHEGGRSERMMLPRRKTAPAGVAIISLQTGKGFHLRSTPEHPPQRRRPTTSNAERMETVPCWRGGRATTPKTTQQRLQGGERRPQALSLLAQHSTEQSFRSKLLGARRRPPATNINRRQRQRTAPQPAEAPHHPTATTGSGPPTSGQGKGRGADTLTPNPRPQAAPPGPTRPPAAANGMC